MTAATGALGRRGLDADAASVRAGGLPFWLRPTVLLVITLGLPALVLRQVPRVLFFEEWKTLKFFTDGDALNIAAAVAAFALGAAAVAGWNRLVRPDGIASAAEAPEVPEHEGLLRFAFYLSGGLTVIGTTIWIMVSARHGVHGSDVLRALGGDAGAVAFIRQRAVTVPGITTMSQFGIAMAVLAGLLWFRAPCRTARRFFLAIVALTLVRALVRAERLALLEMLVPFCVALLPGLIRRQGWRPGFRIALLALPLLAVATLFGFFMVAELGRSYRAKVREGTHRGLVQYSAVRLAGYYGTALNNGAFLSRQLDHGPLPYYVLDWLWRFPGVDDVVDVRQLTGVGERDFEVLLDADLNPEFNNPSGFFAYRHDFGPAGVVVFFAVLGAGAGWLFVRFRAGRLSGLLLYPVAVNGLLEISRLPYLSGSRVFPSLVLLSGLAGICWVSSWRLPWSLAAEEEHA